MSSIVLDSNLKCNKVTEIERTRPKNRSTGLDYVCCTRQCKEKKKRNLNSKNLISANYIFHDEMTANSRFLLFSSSSILENSHLYNMTKSPCPANHHSTNLSFFFFLQVFLLLLMQTSASCEQMMLLLFLLFLLLLLIKISSYKIQCTHNNRNRDNDSLNNMTCCWALFRITHSELMLINVKS